MHFNCFTQIFQVNLQLKFYQFRACLDWDPVCSQEIYNNFLGWDCYAGIDTLSLDVNGNILPAYCYTGTKKTIGNWLTDDLAELHWPTDPMKCGDMKCVCVHDIRARKIKI